MEDEERINIMRNAMYERRELERQYRPFIGKVYMYEDCTVATYGIGMSSRTTGYEYYMNAIILRDKKGRYGDTTKIPFGKLESLEEFPSVLLWGFSQ